MPMPTEFGGTGIELEDIRAGRHLVTRAAPNARYAWDLGIAMRAYFDGLKAGKIRGVYCPHCKTTSVPPRAFCEVCFRPDVRFVDLKNTGRVNTFSICHVRWDVTPADPPEVPAVIEIDGADPGRGILHLLGEVKPEDVKFGMKVRAVWRSPRQRRGAITDIKYFRPV